MSTTGVPTESSALALPEVPLTLEGASVLHQMLRIRWQAWKALDAHSQKRLIQEAVVALSALETGRQSGLFSMLGHKADLMLIHFRPSLEDLNALEFRLARLGLWDYFDVTTSYVSVVELGLYESSQKTYEALAARGIAPHTPEWNHGVAETLERQRKAMQPRLFPEVPEHKYVCFYPMDRRRGETANWYRLPMAERARQMHEHGMVGRRYAGEVRQIISGSIGWDDWEWGVDLFAEDPVVFKKLIYEMRFDEVSALYALFGPFYIGLRRKADDLPALLGG